MTSINEYSINDIIGLNIRMRSLSNKLKYGLSF